MSRLHIALLAAGLVLTGACAGTSTNDGKSAGGQVAGGTATAAAASSAAAKPAQKGPWTSFADGTYEVGAGDGQVAAGKYKTTVPGDSAGCYYARLKDTSGDIGSILANDLADPNQPVIVTIKASDGAFKTERCGTWVKS